MSIKTETKSQRFKRIATNRTRRILNDFRLLGNCANTRNYEYTDKEVTIIFSAIDKELRRIKSLFSKKEENFSLD